MDKFKKFLRDKKVDKHFKRTGPGQKLTDSSSSQTPSIVAGAAQGSGIDKVAAADVAAQAALKRLYKNEPTISSSQKKIQMLAQRELEEERKLKDPAYALSKLGLEEPREPEVREFEHSDVIQGVFYTCELLGDDVVMKKADILVAIEEFLHEQLAQEGEDTVVPAVLLLHSLNKKQAREVAVETLGKYLQNIIENPTEPKFRRIRMSNKAFQERVASVKGGKEFLAAVGFVEEMLAPKEGEPEEAFHVMPLSRSAEDDTAHLVGALETLRDGQSVPIKVSRDMTVFSLKANQRVTVPRLPAEFFDLTAEEVKKEQQLKTEDAKRMLALRTREMRERDEKLRQYKYKYTLIRVRLPDRFVVQGTFGCYETLGAVRAFIHDLLATERETCAWVLRDPMNGTKEMSENKSLAELGLVPAAVLHLDWLDNVDGPSLNAQCLEAAKELVV